MKPLMVEFGMGSSLRRADYTPTFGLPVAFL